MNETRIRCRECRREKKEKNFDKTNGAKKGLRLDCIKCVNIMKNLKPKIPYYKPEDIHYPIMTERFLLGDFYDEFLKKIEAFNLIQPITQE